jgi:eukaryotic-like serine/threonine-protein kinase
MGEVYRARDTRLDRTVAIKVLTGGLSADPESRARFEQEARAIAALNDPHICTLYDISLHGDLDYLVLEYLEGETLADQLKRSPVVPVAEALAIAIQIGDALDRAHRAGIAHRDLKPGNVMLTRRSGSGAPSGKTVKLLDFGLAARTSVARPQALDSALAATMAPTMAATSGLVGTIQYMAPERLDGADGDHRADIFALGCVLYEMLAGRKAFEGSNVLTAVAAIKNSEPPPVAALQAQPLLDHVVCRCLAKDPEDRWQSIRDVTSELRWIAEHPQSPAAGSPGARAGAAWRMATGIAVLVAIVASAAAGLFLRGRETPANQQEIRFEVATNPTDDPAVALSADGTTLAFVANQDRIPMLWIRPLRAIENRVLAGTEGASFPFWSPDGRSIGFFAGNKLKRVDVAGGAPIVLADAPNARGGDWNADGVILFSPGVSAPIMRVSASGGAVEQLTQPDDKIGPAHRVPQFLPDGRRFLFSSTLGGPPTNGVYLGSLDKTPPVRLLGAGDTGGRFVAPDKLLAIRQNALQVYDFDLRSGTVQGQPTMIAQGFTAGIATSSFATSATGVLAYRASTAQRRQLVWVDRRGTVLQAIGEPETDYIASPELSADDRTALVFTQRSGNNDCWVIELARNLPHRITDGPAAHAHPVWDPDGDHIVYNSGVATRQAINGGKPEPLFAQPRRGTALAWTRDRQYVLLRRDNGTSGDLLAVSMTGEPREIAVAQSSADETEGQFSPDGRWVAFVSNESGRAEVFLQSFPDGRGRTQVSTSGGTQVRWSADAKEIFYVAPDGTMTAVSVALGGGSPDVKSPVPLFQTHLATGTNVLGNKPQYAVSRDGRFLLNTAVESVSPPVAVVVNWMKRPPR